MPDSNSFKIVFSDIDGTLLNAEREASAVLKTEVARLTGNGIPFILISSRMPQAMRWIQEDLGISGQPLICYNGGLVRVDGKAIHSVAIGLDIVREIATLQRGTGLSVQLFNADEWYVESMDHYAEREQNNTRVSPQVRSLQTTIINWDKRALGAHKVMVMGEPAEIDKLAGRLERYFGKRLHLYRSKDTYLEIASKRISKLTGIEQLLAHQYPGLTLADCIAFGNHFNDIEMLKAVGLGVAVANAIPEVLAVADVTTIAAKEDGVAIALKEYIH
ncbi:MAG: Cof subfamily protein (haloacid dehalogenase superfamily) [Neolewinella sp.]|jgi:Cof subfamily protein (haloacid dehalogenase superfamily)